MAAINAGAEIPYISSALVFLSVLAVYCFSRGPLNWHSEHAIQAAAWLSGHFYVDSWRDLLHEKIVWRGHWYILHPPLPAVVMLPFVAAGAGNQLFPLIFIGSIGAVLIYRLTESLWLTAFFAFGTPYWYAATTGDPWSYCLALSCMLTAAALLAARNSRPGWTGVWAGLSALARYDMAMVLPVYAVLLKGRRVRYFIPVGAAVVLYVLNAELRFGKPYDIALWQWWKIDAPTLGLKVADGPFSLKYLPMGLYTALFLSPGFTPYFPWLRLSSAGQSLLTTSPAFLLALRASLKDRRILLLWSAVILEMSGALCVWSNGVAQWGARYWIQAYPFLFALMARQPVDQMAKVLIVASIAMNVFAMWYVRSNYPF